MANETDNIRGDLKEIVVHLEKRLNRPEKITNFNETVLINAVKKPDPELFEESKKLAKELTGIERL